MKFSLKNKFAKPSLKAIRRLKSAGFEAYWVGGSVRDILLKRIPKDFDVVTSASVKAISRLFPKHLKVGKKFGILIVTEFQHPVEIATFRKDLRYVDGRRPVGIQKASLQEDVLRRDFTVNGFLYDPIKKRILDTVRGREDLKNKIIRTIGDPEKRFQEDHLRMLRAIRFAVQLGFRIEKKTWSAICKNSKKIKRISAERVREELLKIFSSPSPDQGLALLERSGLLRVILPEVQKLRGVKQSKKYHPEGDVLTHTGLVLKALGKGNRRPEPALVMAGLLHDIEKPSTYFKDRRGIHFYGHETKGVITGLKILKRLRFSREDQDRVNYMIRNHLRWFSAPEMRLTRLRNHFVHPYFRLALELLRADSEGSNGDIHVYRYIKAQLKKVTTKGVTMKPFIRGRDLIAMGLNQGPIIGKILKEVEEKRLEETLKTPDEALKWVKKTYFHHI